MRTVSVVRSVQLKNRPIGALLSNAMKLATIVPWINLSDFVRSAHFQLTLSAVAPAPLLRTIKSRSLRGASLVFEVVRRINLC